MRALLVCINQRWIVEAASMTHAELVATLNSKQFMGSRSFETPYFALRAVVELHKPFMEDKLFCSNCMDAYPCETISVLERQL